MNLLVTLAAIAALSHTDFTRPFEVAQVSTPGAPSIGGSAAVAFPPTVAAASLPAAHPGAAILATNVF